GRAIQVHGLGHEFLRDFATSEGRAPVRTKNVSHDHRRSPTAGVDVTPRTVAREPEAPTAAVLAPVPDALGIGNRTTTEQALAGRNVSALRHRIPWACAGERIHASRGV